MNPLTLLAEYIKASRVHGDIYGRIMLMPPGDFSGSIWDEYRAATVALEAAQKALLSLDPDTLAEKAAEPVKRLMVMFMERHQSAIKRRDLPQANAYEDAFCLALTFAPDDGPTTGETP